MFAFRSFKIEQEARLYTCYTAVIYNLYDITARC